MIKEVKVLNEFNVSKVHWESKEFEVFCPLGQDWCTHVLEVDLVCGRYIMDCYKIDDWITENIKGQTMTVEETGHTLYKYLLQELDPVSLRVTVRWQTYRAVIGELKE